MSLFPTCERTSLVLPVPAAEGFAWHRGELEDADLVRAWRAPLPHDVEPGFLVWIATVNGRAGVATMLSACGRWAFNPGFEGFVWRAAHVASVAWAREFEGVPGFRDPDGHRYHATGVGTRFLAACQAAARRGRPRDEEQNPEGQDSGHPGISAHIES